MLQLFQEEDLYFEEDEEEQEAEKAVREPTNKETSLEKSQTSTISSPDGPCPGLESLLSNPSIQVYPQRPELVQLGSVQELSSVFDQLYQDQPLHPGPSREAELPKRPRPSYTKYR